MHQVKHQKESQRRALARYGNLDMRNRLQSMYRVEDSADSMFEDLFKRLDDAAGATSRTAASGKDLARGKDFLSPN